MTPSINVFISHPSPCNKFQDNFLRLIHIELNQHGLNPVNLGKNSWNFQSPLKPIKELMDSCSAAVIIGLERHHSYIGCEREFSKNSKETIHRYTSSPWIQIEAGMAYQANLPILILKESRVYGEGILDPQTSESFVFDFDLKKTQKTLSPELNAIILSWTSHFKV